MKAGHTTAAFVLDFSTHQGNERLVTIEMKQEHDPDSVKGEVKFFTDFEVLQSKRYCYKTLNIITNMEYVYILYRRSFIAKRFKRHVLHV